MRRRVVHIERRSGFTGPTSWHLQLDCGHTVIHKEPPVAVRAAECETCEIESNQGRLAMDMPNATTPDRGSAVVGSTGGEVLPPDELLTQLRSIKTKIKALAKSLDGATGRGGVTERLRAVRTQEALQAADEQVGEAVGHLAAGDPRNPGEAAAAAVDAQHDEPLEVDDATT